MEPSSCEPFVVAGERKRNSATGSDSFVWGKEERRYQFPRRKGSIPWNLWRQHVAALLASIAGMCGGVAIGWSAAALPTLQAGSLGLSLEQASWVGSLASLGALLGALPAGPLAQRIGRRRALLALSAPFLAGSLLLTFANSVWMLYLGRLLTGPCLGASTVLVALYCEEMAEVRIRGALGTYLNVFLCLGVLWAYAMGVLLSYFWYNVSCCVLPVAFAASFYWMPESPVFLAGRGRLADARAALLWFRNAGPNYDPQPELDAIVAEFRRAGSGGKGAGGGAEDGDCGCGCSGGGGDSSGGLVNSFLSCWASNTARALRMVLGLMFFQQGSGITGVTYYTVQLLQEAKSSISPGTSLIILGVVNVAANFVSTLFVERCGRKPLLFISCLVMGLSLVAMAAHARFGEGVAGWGWVPLASIAVYYVMYSTGIGPLPWFMMAELIPMQAKSWAASVSVCFNRIITFLVAKEFLPLGVLFGKDTVYAAFAFVCFLGALFSLTCVLETKGKPREQIQRELQGDSS